MYNSCLFRILLIVGIPVALLAAYFGLNYSGFCFAQMRYLSDEEKIRLAFNTLNNAEELRVEVPGKGYEYREFIKYESFDEYLKDNPDCCTVNPPGGSDLPPPSNLDRLFGFRSYDFARIKFKVRYLDEKGQQKTQVIRGDIPLTNCGESASFLD